MSLRYYTCSQSPTERHKTSQGFVTRSSRNQETRDISNIIHLPMEETELYFAFGSNLSERLMQERGTKFLSRERAMLQGFRVVFNIWKDDGFGYANIAPDEKSTVYGALYVCEKGSLAKLDEHEAGRLGRVTVTVEKESGEVV